MSVFYRQDGRKSGVIISRDCTVYLFIICIARKCLINHGQVVKAQVYQSETSRLHFFLNCTFVDVCIHFTTKASNQMKLTFKVD